MLERDVRELKTQPPSRPDTRDDDTVQDLDSNSQRNNDSSLLSESMSHDSVPEQSNYDATTTTTTTRYEIPNDRAAFVATPPMNVDDLASGAETMSPAILSELIDLWFSHYYSWIPILHKPTVWETLQDTHSLPESPLYIVFKAITAVTITDTKQTPLSQLCDEDRERLALSFRCQIVMEAMGSTSLQSLQALIIVSILDYGAGRFSDFWNLVALGKRHVDFAQFQTVVC